MNKKTRIIYQKLKNIFWHLPKNYLLALKYGFPAKKLTLIGITGTDGKTTVCDLVYQTLSEAGFKVGMINTLGAKIGPNDLSTKLHMTSPDPEIIQKILKMMVKKNITHAVLEVTAHALDQYRYLGCQFLVSAITNTSHEHLDDFLDIKSYTIAKSKLFNFSKYSILNKDDQSYSIIKDSTKSSITTYSINNPSDYQAKNITQDSKYLKFNVNDQLIVTDSNYYYQIYNILVALAVIDKLKIDPQLFLKIIKNFPEIRGRRQLVPNDLGIKTIVDFAHTPGALEQTLTSLKRLTKGNLIVLFGATGGRDPSKRPFMGKASQIANIAILTADDTRNENVETINQQIISGFDPNNSK